MNSPTLTHPLVMGWVSDLTERRQVTHAVWTGRTVAECGVKTTRQGDGWPLSGESWNGPAGRCPVCATAAYGAGPTDWW